MGFGSLYLKVKEWLGGKADVVMSDMAAASSGHKQTDHLRIIALCEAAAYFAFDVLEEGGTTMTGKMMEYNYKTEKGRVVKGRSELEGGQFVGDQVKRVDANTFNLSHSTYTTCELDSSPHFHFEARRMKMMPKDKVIAKPIVAKIGNIPVFMLPFAVFPHKSGRSSGIIIPTYGQSALEGRYLRQLGYYWAPNDYFDAKGMVDFFEKSGFLFSLKAFRPSWASSLI